MVERLNRSLLQLLRSYVDKQYDWEQHLPLLLYAYRTASHSSTGVKPFVLMMGCDPILPLLPSVSTSLNYAYDPHSFEHSLRVKMADLNDLVECHIAQERTNRQDFMILKLKADHSKWETLFGYIILPLGSLAQNGREDGL